MAEENKQPKTNTDIERFKKEHKISNTLLDQEQDADQFSEPLSNEIDQTIIRMKSITEAISSGKLQDWVNEHQKTVEFLNELGTIVFPIAETINNLQSSGALNDGFAKVVKLLKGMERTIYIHDFTTLVPYISLQMHENGVDASLYTFDELNAAYLYEEGRQTDIDKRIKPIADLIPAAKKERDALNENMWSIFESMEQDDYPDEFLTYITQNNDVHGDETQYEVALDDIFYFSRDEKGNLVENSLFLNLIRKARAGKKKFHDTHRTRNKIQHRSISVVPKDLAIITSNEFRNALGLIEEGAHLQMVTVDNLRCENGYMYFIDENGEVRRDTRVQLKDIKTNKGVNEIDTTLLTTFYSTLLQNYFECEKLTDTFSVYAPDLAEKIGYGSNINQSVIDRILAKAKSFHNIVGVVPYRENSESYFAVLNFEEYDAETNTITLSSPYMRRIIESVMRSSVKRNADGTPFLKDGKQICLPSHSRLISSKINKESNKAAIENVRIICTLIEQCGNNTPHIKGSTLLSRNPQLQEQLSITKNKSVTLKRCFTQTWKFLKEYTDLERSYVNIKLPDPNNPRYIPTLSAFNDTVFKFPHKGKMTTKE